MFEYDKNKSVSNLEKHGIDFVEAQLLWDDADLLEIPAKTTDEPRSLVIGMIDIGAKVGKATFVIPSP